MEELVERCAGLDVHQAEITACAGVPGEHGGVVEIVEEFGTTTPDLLAMVDWLTALGVTEVAMESTGVFWKSPYFVMEGTSTGCWWSTPPTSSTSRDARPTSSTPRGSPSCWPTGCSGGARPAAPDPGAPGPHPVPQGPHRGAEPGGQPEPRDPGGRRGESRRGGLGRDGGLRSGHDASAHRGAGRSRGLGGAGQGEAPGQAARAAQGPHLPVPGPPRIPARADARPRRRPGVRHRGRPAADRGGGGPFRPTG